MSLIDCLSTTGPLAELFSDRSVLQAMLDVEAALARACARAGAIPAGAADAIVAAARAEEFDASAIARDARRSATPAIPLVDALRAHVRNTAPESATYVHWGATSQDVTDTAVVLLLLRARPLVAADHTRLETRLRELSDRHADTVMTGRTLLQPAPPVTFGLKAAGWRAAAVRGWRRLDAAWTDTGVLQFGGAAGTLAALGPRAHDVASGMAQDLGLAAVPPWHTDRERLGGFVTAAAIYTASLGKMARDIALLMQPEIAEVAERGGGSSAMPHKKNPAGCTMALAAAARMPGLASAFLTGMLQEHERAAGGGQAEPATLAAVVQTTGSAAAALAEAVEGLTIDAARMRANLEATRGVVYAEQAMVMLAPRVGRDVAQRLVEAALARASGSGSRFADAFGDLPEVQRVLTPDEIGRIAVPERYLGSAEAFRRRLLEE